MRDNDASVKKSSVFSRMFGAVHRAALRCVAVIAIAVTSLFAFDIKPAEAYNGVRIQVKPTSSILSVSMQFNFGGTLTITASGATCKFTDTGNLISSSGDTFVSGTPRTVTCAYSSAGTYYISLQYSNVTGYPSYTNNSTAPAAATYSTFRFSANPTIVTGVTNGTLGDVFYTLSSGGNGNQPLFIGTFSGCTGLSSISNNLFAGGDAHSGGISGTAAYWMFAQTFANTGISALPSRGSALYGLFRSLTPAIGMFYQTFASNGNLTGNSALTADVFYGMGQTPQIRMFWGMFYNCNKLTEVPSDFFTQFSDDGGNTPQYLFYQTFLQCTNLQTITGIFTGVNNGKCTSYMFRETFKSTGLTSLPDNLFSSFTGVQGAGMFYSTFENCSKLSTLNSTIFTGMRNAPASNLFQYTFRNCTAITVVPAGFFSNFTGQPASSMFYGTFYGCTKLQVITNIFQGVGSAVTSTTKNLPTYLFRQTFYGCTKLAPGNNLIFAPFDGWNIATYDFYQTFYNCKGESALDGNLFKGIKGAPSNYAFYQTFYGCEGLYGPIPANLFSGLSGAMGTNAFYQMFYNCTNLGKTSSSASTGTHYIYPWLFYNMSASSAAPVNGIFTNTALVTTCPSGTTPYTGAPYNTISSNFNSKVVCDITMPATKFSMTLTALSAGDVISFTIYAEGDFYVRWKSGAPVEKRTSNSAAVPLVFEHTYPTAASAGTITIELSSANNGRYLTSSSYTCGLNGPCSTFDLDSSTKIKSLNLSLGALFPVYSSGTSDGDQPRFYRSFLGATNLETLSSTLFSGLTGSTASTYMFSSTFANCTSLASVPSSLFSSVTTSADSMFERTFANCTLLASVPSGLFSTITTPAANMFKETFTYSGLTAIPNGLFGSLTGSVAAGMFDETFSYCTSLQTQLPDILFGNLSGVPQNNSFEKMFYHSSSLSGYIPPKLFMNFTKWTTDQDQMNKMFQGTSLATDCSGFANAPYQFYTGYESGSTTTQNNSFQGKVSCFNGLTINTSAISSFTVPFAAAGNFYIGWGDDTFSQKSIAYPTMYADSSKVSHTYTGSAVRRIQIGGTGTAYNEWAPVRFMGYGTITSIEGSVGYMFPGSPVFDQMFKGCSNLTSIPSTLFDGITAITPRMFQGVFVNCTHLTQIPNDLFRGINGLAPAEYMFNYMFEGTTGLTQIPASLFSGMGTTPANYMFRKMFYNSGLTSIPDTLFDRFNNKRAATGMFQQTFAGSTNLTGSLPSGLFDGLTGTPNPEVFDRTFSGCTKLYGALPDTFTGMSGSIADSTFYQTFYGCTNLGKNAVNGTSTYYIPPTFFGGITPNANATNPTYQMFTGTGLLTECPGVYNQYFTGFETFVDGSNAPKVSCKRCAYLPGQASYGNTCYNLCNLNGDNMTKLHVGDNWFHLFAQSEATNFAHHLNFKYGNNATDICFVPLNSGLDNANSGSLNFNDGGSQRYHAKRSGTTSRSGGEQTKTKQ
ncbi:MAG: hypothetical protein K6B71_03175 [Alphaproteobacteria bacterium]|nr:hypothetical protein [Alphaproteobacteria bacterium]